MNVFKREFTLTKPKMYLKQDSKKFIYFYKKILRIKEDEEEQSHWYYVHFLSNDYVNMKKYINIESRDEIAKNTFVLFLSFKQLELISNISLVKKLEPSDKFYEENGPIEEANYFIIRTAPNYELLNNDDLYSNERKNSASTFVIRVDKKSLTDIEYTNKKKQAIKYLTEIPEVKSVSTFKKPDSKNALATGFTQRNTFDFDGKTSWRYFKSDRYLNRNGLNGENQIVTILDTPIDIYHAMFRDDEVPIELNKEMPNHRKIIYYDYDGTKEDLQKNIETYEHGTHCSGTIAGKSVCIDDTYDINDFDGNAPEAKILYAGYYDKCDKMADLMNKYHSTISSNSWGSTDYHPEMNYFGNEIAHKNPQSVFIFAAGNEYQLLKGNFSVCDPGGAKNVLTVGAIDSFYLNNARTYLFFNRDFPNNYLLLSSSPTVRIPQISGTIGKDLFVINTENGNQCKSIEGNEKPSILYGKIYDWINTCNYTVHDQLFFAQNDPEVAEYLKDGSQFILRNYLEIDETKGIERAIFSSTDPGFLGILKPDVMAPGTRIVSAKSIKNSNKPHGCYENIFNDLAFMDGTSMATPNIAGAMALVHQYFNSGKWIESVNLDGAISRALIINSAKHPLNSKIPDIWYGHGVVDLSTILSIENDFGVQITRQGVDSSKKHSVQENGHVIGKIDVKVSKSNKTKLQITMSYIDQLMNIDTYIPITRDLDLVVVSPSKKVYFGDHLENGDTQHASTNEKVIINEDEVEDGQYTIHIYGNEFADSGISGNERQDFAVVATGPINNGYIDFIESNECPCEKCDPQNPGYCLCEEGYVGPICQAKIETINGNEGKFNVGTLRIKRVRFISDKKIKSVKSKSNHPGRYVTIWASEKCNLSLGSYEPISSTGTENKEKAGSIGFGKKEVCIAIFNNNDEEATYYIEVSDKKIINWVLIICIVVAVVIILIITIIIVFCCIKGKCKCKCCTKKNEFDSTTGQSLLNDNNRL